MKKIYSSLFLVVVILLSASIEDASAQGRSRKRRVANNYRHITGSHSIEGQVSLSNFGQVYQLGFLTHFSQSFYGRATGFYELGEYNDLAFNSYGLDAEILYQVFNSGKLYFFNVSGGLTATLDQVSGNGEFVISQVDTDTQFKYGFVFGIEPEFFISNKISIIGHFKQNLFLNSDFGSLRFRGGMGVRFFL